MESFDNLDLWEQELDFRLNNPVYPPFQPTSDFDPSSIFTAPDGHLYTPEEMAAIANQNPVGFENPQLTETVGKVSYDSQPDGTVIVTDIFGGKHSYMSMEQAQANTDILSGMPCKQFSSMPSPGSIVHSSDNTNPKDDYSARPFEDSKHDQIVFEEQKRIQQEAVENYKEAISKGDVEEARKWEKIAIDAEYSKQAHSKFYPTYGLDVRTLSGLDK